MTLLYDLSYNNPNKYTEALDNLKEGLNIRHQFYQDYPHSSVIQSLENITKLCLNSIKANPSQALQCYHNAIVSGIQHLEAKISIYGNKDHPEIALLLSELSMMFLGQVDIDGNKGMNSLKWAIHYGSEALQIIQQFPNHQFCNSIKSGLEIVAKMFAIKNDMNIDYIKQMVVEAAQYHEDFTNAAQHKLYLDEYVKSNWTIESIIECRLVQLFASEEEKELKSEVTQILTCAYYEASLTTSEQKLSKDFRDQAETIFKQLKPESSTNSLCEDYVDFLIQQKGFIGASEHVRKSIFSEEDMKNILKYFPSKYSNKYREGNGAIDESPVVKQDKYIPEVSTDIASYFTSLEGSSEECNNEHYVYNVGKMGASA